MFSAQYYCMHLLSAFGKLATLAIEVDRPGPSRKLQWKARLCVCLSKQYMHCLKSYDISYKRQAAIFSLIRKISKNNYVIKFHKGFRYKKKKKGKMFYSLLFI